MSEKKKTFIEMMAPHVRDAAARTGLDPRLILAQSALETGWGGKAPGHNYFGIKSHNREGGQNLTTTEYVGGAPVKKVQSFREYSGPKESIQDYANFILQNPRYQEAMKAKSIEDQIKAIGSSGYATDPRYGKKLRAVALGIELPPEPPPENKPVTQEQRPVEQKQQAQPTEQPQPPEQEAEAVSYNQIDPRDEPVAFADGGSANFIPHDDPRRVENLSAFLAKNHPDVPHVVYHGSDRDILSFDPEKAKSEGNAFFFSKDWGVKPTEAGARNAGTYAPSRGGSIYPVHLSMKDPHIVGFTEPMPHNDATQDDWDRYIGRHQKFDDQFNDDRFKERYFRKAMEAAKYNGNDGVIFKGITDDKIHHDIWSFPSDIFAVFNPSQIKSATGNSGNFDASEPDINKADGGAIDDEDKSEATGGAAPDEAEAGSLERPMRAIRAYHSSPTKFLNYDWAKLGENTHPEVSGFDIENWAMNLAKVGPWAHETDLTSRMGGGYSLPVQITGTPAKYRSLDSLEKAISKAGGPANFRQSMVDKGYGHIVVNDEEFKGKSYVGLSPKNFSIERPAPVAAKAPTTKELKRADGGEVVNHAMAIVRALGGRIGYANEGAVEELPPDNNPMSNKFAYGQEEPNPEYRQPFLDRVIEGTKKGFGTDRLGLSAENQSRYDPTGIVQTFAAPADFALRTPGAINGFIASILAGGYGKIPGVDETQTNSANRDLYNLGNAAMLQLGNPSARAPTDLSKFLRSGEVLPPVPRAPPTAIKRAEPPVIDMYGEPRPSISPAFDLPASQSRPLSLEYTAPVVEPPAAPVRRAKEVPVAAPVPTYHRQLSPLGFYSHGAETAANLAQPKGTPQQFRGMLEKYGVKPVEMEGFDEAFAGRPSVTREELAKHFNERRPQVEETVLGGDVKAIQSRIDALDNVRQDRRWTDAEEGEYRRLVGILNDDNAPTTKFQQYTLPGGENYREILLTASDPQGSRAAIGRKYNSQIDELTKNSQALNDEAKRLYISNAPDNDFIRAKDSASDAYFELRTLTEQRDKELGLLQYEKPFTSSHWEQPNVLAHFRVTDRPGPNGGKYLHLEEAQSDYGQQGKKVGFYSDDATAAANKERNAARMEQVVVELEIALNGRAYKDLLPEQVGPVNALVEESRLIAKYPQGIPPAPYVTNTAAWTDLVLKRLLKEAAEGGYDGIVWTPGVEQAKRYPEGGPKREEGLKTYYDKILPKQLQKLLKKLDPEAKVNPSDVMLPKGMMGHNNPPSDLFAAPSFAITPKMRESIMKGQRYADGGAVDDEDEGLTAYHGSPHDFEQFDTGQIGTGEGAQAYGHGLYFAEAEPVAKEYRDKLTAGMYKGDTGKVLDPFSDLEHMNVRVAAYKSIDNAIDRAKGLLADEDQSHNADMINRDLVKLMEAKAQNATPQTGRMYEVKINAHPDHFLDWDAPVYEQPQFIQDAVKKSLDYAKENAANGPSALSGMFVNSERSAIQAHSDKYLEHDGAVIQNMLEKVLGAQGTSDALAQHGVKGIKYFDVGSRGQGGSPNAIRHNLEKSKAKLAEWQEVDHPTALEQRAMYQRDIDMHERNLQKALANPPTRNYVVFNHDHVQVKRKYAQGGAIAGAEFVL